MVGQHTWSAVLQMFCDIGTKVVEEAVLHGRCKVAPLVPSWFEREGRAKETVHIIAALSGTKYFFMSLSSHIQLCWC